MRKLVVGGWLLVVGAMLSVFGEGAAFARETSVKMRLDTRSGARIAAKGASEAIAYSPRWAHDDGVRGAPYRRVR